MLPYPLGDTPRVTVPRERARGLLARHPWIFANALHKPPRNLPAGAVVEVVDEKGRFLARGGWNDHSQITVRVLSFADESIDEAFIARRIAAAIARRAGRLTASDTACRLVFGEADGLPGLIVDRYGDWLVVQFLSACLESWRPVVSAALAGLGARGIVERSDSEERRTHEGLEPRSGLLWGEAPPATVDILEHGLHFGVDLLTGHKTGCYLDQRDNRAAVAAWAAGRRVLNAFSYSGGFGLHAAAAGAAAVTHVDSSAAALALAAANATANGQDGQEFVAANVFDALRGWREERREFDLIVLDPPKFAASRKQLERATRGYRDLNQAALRVLAPGGLLATFSCSGAVDAALLQSLVAAAAAEAGRDLQVLQWLGQPADHPVLLSFPEGQYLKGLLMRAL
ncbi:MAG: class I SAM-dependent rRNA methyltransferase [Fimbriimonadaceae bacterium]|nr:class I SAM-dependent rRNA methyltransferase [Fimbriimonadaceae bacterium]